MSLGAIQQRVPTSSNAWHTTSALARSCDEYEMNTSRIVCLRECEVTARSIYFVNANTSVPDVPNASPGTFTASALPVPTEPT
jgi:hypothetical protein